MRRWVCIVALLAGFSGTDYVRDASLRRPIPIERPLTEPDDGDPAIDGRDEPRARLSRTIAWWTGPSARGAT
jgi:hypothetical protein